MAKKLTLEDYIITEQGEIINSHTNKALKGQPNSRGYLRVNLCGKRYFIHRLVAEKYVPNPENKEQVNHINGIKTDNRAENLEWVTNTENRQHAMDNNLIPSGEQCSWSKLNWDKVNYIRQHTEMSAEELASKFNVGVNTVKDVLKNVTWKVEKLC